MAEPLLRLFPDGPDRVPLSGAFLGHDLRGASGAGRGFVYTGFVSSLDGRIAWTDNRTGLRAVPAPIANARDWRLFLELVAQADVVLVGDRLLTAFSRGRYPELLDLEGEDFEDLVPWRRERGLPPRPALATVSRRLDFAVPPEFEENDRDLFVLVPDEASVRRERELTARGAEVLRLGPGPMIPGGAVVEALVERGKSLICSVAGPQMFHSLAAAGCLDRLYLTTAQVLLGGTDFDTLLQGERLEPPLGMTLSALYFDSAAPESGGQLIQVLEPSRPEGSGRPSNQREPL